MATLRQAIEILALAPVLSADGAEPIAISGNFVVPAGLALNDVIELAPLPAGYVPLDVTLDAEDADSGGSPAVVFDVGLISGDFGVVDNTRVCGADFIAASTVAQAGGIARMAAMGATRIAPTTNDRGVGVKVKVAAATLVAGAKMTLTLWCRPAINGA